MQPIQVEATVGKGGTLELAGLPFQDGALVAVSVQLRADEDQKASHPLAGMPVTYIAPFEPAVPPEDWEAMQ
jgi:hypothetical protein